MEYREDRDKEFLKACKNILKESGECLSVIELVKKAIHTPASSFFISEREIGKIIREERGNPRSDAKSEMHHVIKRRHNKMKENFPNSKAEGIAKIIAYQEAPRFYITESTARKLYYQLKKKRK
ncbi:MAG: hypothetical protein LBV72_00595 [Tannerella sp.]|jgi:hypothetical protein|nr:hypothetical protein [Tannerella sp.]